MSTKVKLCGLSRPEDIEAANRLRPDYIGFVFAKGSKRQVSPPQAAVLRAALAPHITPVGVFVKEAPETVAALLKAGTIAMAQLHGGEDEAYIKALRKLTDQPIMQAFRIGCPQDLQRAKESTADFILLDAGAGEGKAFRWQWLKGFTRPYFLAGGLNIENVAEAIRRYHPFGVDISSGIETGGKKDPQKMQAFMEEARKAGR